MKLMAHMGTQATICTGRDCPNSWGVNHYYYRHNLTSSILSGVHMHTPHSSSYIIQHVHTHTHTHTYAYCTTYNLFLDYNKREVNSKLQQLYTSHHHTLNIIKYSNIILCNSAIWCIEVSSHNTPYYAGYTLQPQHIYSYSVPNPPL